MALVEGYSRQATDLLLPESSSPESPSSFLFLAWGLDINEHSEPFNWHVMQPSSSSFMIHVIRDRLQEVQGGWCLYASDSSSRPLKLLPHDDKLS